MEDRKCLRLLILWRKSQTTSTLMTSENTWDQGKVGEDEQDDLRGYDLKFKCSHDICKMQPDTNIYKGCVVMKDKNYMKRIHNCSNYHGG